MMTLLAYLSVESIIQWAKIKIILSGERGVVVRSSRVRLIYVLVIRAVP